MSVGPVTMNGVIQRVHDVGTVKQQEDVKPFLDQQNIQIHLKQEGEKHLKQVRHADDSDNHQKKYDAKEKGNNEYQGQQKRKKKTGPKEDGKMTMKAGNSHFDMKI